MGAVLRDEFKLKNFLFDHPKPEAFYVSQWRWHPVVYMVYRVVVLLYCVGWLLDVTISSVHSRDSHNVMAYLTVWTYLALCLYLLSAAASAAVRCARLWGVHTRADNRTPVMRAKFSHNSTAATNPAFVDERSHIASDTAKYNDVIVNGNGVVEIAVTSDTKITDEECASSYSRSKTMEWHMKIQWLLADVIYVFGPIVTGVYFGALYTYGKITDVSGFIMDMNLHGGNTLLILVDVAIVARPVRLLHFVYPVGYGLLYIIFSAIYWSEDKQGNVLYDVLDWNKAGHTCGVVALLTVAVVALHAVQFGLFRLRLLLYRKLYGVAYL